MKKLSLLAASCLLATSVQAEKITHNAAFVTDYVWRGISQTDNGVALQLGSDYKIGNAYAGVWASNIEEQDGAEGAPIEMDVYFGYNNKFGSFNLDTSIRTYNSLDDTNRELTEFRLATNLNKNLTIALHREVKTKYWFPEVSYEKHLPHRLYLDASVGYWSIDDADDSAITARAELARDFPEFHHIDLFGAVSYISDETPGGNNADEDDAETLFLVGVRKNF